jgi:hypothetical protein
MFARRVLPILAGLSVAGASWAAVLIIGLLTGVRLAPMGVAALVAAALVIPGFAVSVVMNASTSGGRGTRQAEFLQLLGHLPRWALVGAGGLFVAFCLAGMTAIGVRGNAEIQGGRYVLNNHGSVTVVDKATYERALDREERFALGMLGGFGVAGATLGAATVARARSAAYFR